MEIVNIGDTLEIESTLIERFKNKEFESLEIKVALNCNEIKLIALSNEVDSSEFCDNTLYTDADDFTYMVVESAIQQHKIITKVVVRDINTGLLHERSGAILPSSYHTKIKTELEALFVSLGVAGATISQVQCNPFKLLYKDIPDGYTLEKLVYQDGSEDYFGTNYDLGVILDDENLKLSAMAIGLEEIDEGIYGITIVGRREDGGWEEDSQCVFIDVDMKCRVASYMKYLLKGDSGKSVENLHILHYSLVNASNCGDCRCSNLCEMYKNIENILNGLVIENKDVDTDCGSCN